MLGLALQNPLKWLQNAFNGNWKVHLDLINSLLWLCWFRIRFSKSNNCQNNADKEQIIPSGSHPKCISSDEFLPQFVKRSNVYFSTKECGNYYLFAPRFAPRSWIWEKTRVFPMFRYHHPMQILLISSKSVLFSKPL